MTQERRAAFAEHLGLVREHAAGGEARVALELRPELTNHHDNGHGGVLMTLLDSAMAHAAISRDEKTRPAHAGAASARRVVTVAMQTSFLQPGTGRLVAHGRATGGGRSVCFCEAQIVDAAGQVVALAMGTYRYRDVD